MTRRAALISTRLITVLLLLLAGLHHKTCIAGSSFESVSFTTVPHGSMTPYRGARLYSENDRDYFIRAFGCEYRLANDISSGDAADQFARRLRSEYMKNPVSVSNLLHTREYLYMTRLLMPKLASVKELNPQTLPCESEQSMLMISIVRHAHLVLAGEPHFSIQIHKFRWRKEGERNYFESPTDLWILLEGNWFTPDQERKLQAAAVDIGIALTKALVKK